MILQANGTKRMYNSTVMNLIEYTEHVTGYTCPVAKEEMAEEFKKVYSEMVKGG